VASRRLARLLPIPARRGAVVRHEVHRQFHRIIRKTRVRPRAALEVGGVMGPKSLLSFPELADASRFCLNLVEMADADGIKAVTGNASNMPFKSKQFDLVLSNATLEHDKHFWLSLREMKRVLRPGGLLIIGVPGYVEDPESDHGRSTHTYRVHYSFDYYRFSEQAVREVFFDGMKRASARVVPNPPRIIGWGWKPNEPPGRMRRLRRRLGTARKRLRAAAATASARRRRSDVLTSKMLAKG
jgi:SAM-dependent methyltransferase